jgi:hypothetical protein
MCFSFPLILRLLPQLTPSPFNETLTRSDETNTSNKCNNNTKSASNITGGPKQAPVTKAKKPTKPLRDNNKTVRSLLVKVTAEDRDRFSFDLKKLNWDSYLENLREGRETIHRER